VIGDHIRGEWSSPARWQDRLDRIKEESDPGARNVLITRTYFDLACGIDRLLGEQDANWLTFGTWASHTAGQFIRGESMAVNWGARHVADGNLAIIEDIAPCFVAYLASVHGSDDERRHPLVVAGQQRIDNDEHLTDAFSSYEKARLRPNDPRDAGRAQSILRGNIGVAYHEQRLADCFVDRAMPLGGLFGIATTKFVQLNLPHLSLDLCDPVPMPEYLQGDMWPVELESIEDPGLERMYRRIGQHPDDIEESAARSWEDFDERMGYIATFFRAFQRDPSLHAAPPLPEPD
jgi:hypothetical protein